MVITNNTPTGGPSEYYDFPSGAVTLNDILEYKADNSWLGDSFHLGNLLKAIWRWGNKGGTSKEYDARKIIYTGCRLLMKYAGKEAVHTELKKLLVDKQFEVKTGKTALEIIYEKPDYSRYTLPDVKLVTT